MRISVFDVKYSKRELHRAPRVTRKRLASSRGTYFNSIVTLREMLLTCRRWYYQKRKRVLKFIIFVLFIFSSGNQLLPRIDKYLFSSYLFRMYTIL